MKPGFDFTIEAFIHLNIDNLWPDGDAPENPTVEDVKNLIEKCGGVRGVIQDWNLDEDLDLTVIGEGGVVTLHGFE